MLKIATTREQRSQTYCFEKLSVDDCALCRVEPTNTLAEPVTFPPTPMTSKITNYQGQIAAQLADFRTLGQKEAAKHRPPTDASSMDQNETSLQSEAHKWLADEQRIFDMELVECNRAAIEVQQKATELQSKVDQLVSDTSLQSTIEADMSGERRELVAATEARLKAEVDYRAFRAANAITEQAVYPASHVWHFAIVLALALLETVINAFFYENANGLMGGFTVALGIAAVNMAGALLLGIGFRYKNLASMDKKLLGWMSLLLFFVFAIYCNALFATFRAEYQLLTDPTDTLELRRAFAASMAEARKIFYLDMLIADMMSFVLLGIGLLLSLLAFYKGYTFDDRYPGHGAKDRAMRMAQRVELDRQDTLRQKVKNFLHHRRGEVQAAVHEPAQLINRAASRTAELQQAQGLLSSQAGAVQRDFSLVLGAYRDANAAVRATTPPAYFKEVPELTHRASDAAAQPVLFNLASLQDSLKALRERNQDTLNQLLQQHQGDSAQILNSTFSQFLRDVEDEAKERIDRHVHAIHRAMA